MTTEELLLQVDRILKSLATENYYGSYTQACEFLRKFAGPKSSFYEGAKAAAGWSEEWRKDNVIDLLKAFKEFVKAGLLEGISPVEKARLDVVSDILNQAHRLLSDKKTHPAAAAVLVGASLEEFLRTWVEREGLSLGNAKPGIDSYSKVLRTADLISTQDIKDITSWGGMRNHAAHGEWDSVSDSQRIALMLEGVNLFMRKYTS